VEGKEEGRRRKRIFFSFKNSGRTYGRYGVWLNGISNTFVDLLDTSIFNERVTRR